MKAHEIKRLVESYGGGYEGKRRFVAAILNPLLEGKTLQNGQKLKRKPEDFSLQQLWIGLVGELSETLPMGRLTNDGVLMSESALTSTMFPTAAGNIIQRKVIEAYNMPGLIGDRLVEVMRSNLKSETISGMTAAQSPKTVEEGMPYEEATMTDKYVTTETSKKGRLISVTEETITHDQTNQILRRARMIGEETAMERERTILNGVTGVNTNVYKPSGVATTLYDASAFGNLLTSNSLNDWNDIDDVKKHHAANITDDRSAETGQPILWMPNILLCHTNLEFTARRIINATEVRQTTATNNLTVSGNPVSGIEVLPTPLLPGTNTDWYLGDFMRQFIWHEIWPVGTFAQGATSESGFERDIVARFKVRYYGGIAALDTRWVIKSTA